MLEAMAADSQAFAGSEEEEAQGQSRRRDSHLAVRRVAKCWSQ